MTYTNEEKAAILARAREVIESAEASLAEPRPEIEPHVESRAERWRREADEQSARMAAERAKSDPLTEYQAARLEARLAGLVEQEKRLVLDVLAEVVAEVRGEFEAKVAELEQKVLAISETKTDKAEVIDLPAWARTKTA